MVGPLRSTHVLGQTDGWASGREREANRARDVRRGLGSTGKPYVSLGNGLSAAQHLPPDFFS